ncbi:MAG: FlxA-like family protein [Lachnospiraceae bacterium]
MMAVGNITDINNMQPGYAGRNMQADSVSKNIQKQIADAQKQLQELSSNEDMSIEEKMKKRQEIQQKITNLNQQLMQYQTRQRKQQQNGSSIDSLAAKQKKRGKAKAGINKSTLSQAGMESMLSAGSSIEQAKIQGSVATKMENRAEILKTEMKYDAGGNTEAKQAELAEMEQKAVNASAMQTDTLSDARQKMEESEEAQGQENNTDKTGSKAKTGKAQEENTDIKNNTDAPAEEIHGNTEITPRPVAYKPIDISL